MDGGPGTFQHPEGRGVSRRLKQGTWIPAQFTEFQGGTPTQGGTEELNKAQRTKTEANPTEREAEVLLICRDSVPCVCFLGNVPLQAPSPLCSALNWVKTSSLFSQHSDLPSVLYCSILYSSIIVSFSIPLTGPKESVPRSRDSVNVS